MNFSKIFAKATKSLNRVNLGGCGLVALKASEALTAAKIPHTIRIRDFNISSFASNAQELNDNLCNTVRYGVAQDLKGWDILIPLHHVVIEIEGTLYDSDGIYGDLWDFDEDEISEPVLYDTLKLLVETTRLWNSNFREANTVEDIENFITQGFSGLIKAA